MAINIAVVCGSVRKNRRSIWPARFIQQKIKDAGHESTLVDFLELPLPFVDSDPNPSSLNKQYPYENVQKWSGIADAADAFVIVTPEYNHGYSPVIKNALDWLYAEFEDKPVGLCGVSDGQSGGLRAIEQLRPLMANFSMYDIQEAVAFRSVQNSFDEQGNVLDNKVTTQVEKMLSALTKTAEAMKVLRT